MSNTGRKKKLASFNCDQELWETFMRRCQEQGTTATATLTRFISHYLDAEADNLDAHLGKTGEEETDDQVNAVCEQFLAERLPSHLDDYLSTYQGMQGTQSVVFPAADVDLLDAAIQGVLARASSIVPKAT